MSLKGSPKKSDEFVLEDYSFLSSTDLQFAAQSIDQILVNYLNKNKDNPKRADTWYDDALAARGYFYAFVHRASEEGPKKGIHFKKSDMAKYVQENMIDKFKSEAQQWYEWTPLSRISSWPKGSTLGKDLQLVVDAWQRALSKSESDLKQNSQDKATMRRKSTV